MNNNVERLRIIDNKLQKRSYKLSRNSLNIRPKFSLKIRNQIYLQVSSKDSIEKLQKSLKFSQSSSNLFKTDISDLKKAISTKAQIKPRKNPNDLIYMDFDDIVKQLKKNKKNNSKLLESPPFLKKSTKINTNLVSISKDKKSGSSSVKIDYPSHPNKESVEITNGIKSHNKSNSLFNDEQISENGRSSSENLKEDSKIKNDKRSIFSPSYPMKERKNKNKHFKRISSFENSNNDEKIYNINYKKSISMNIQINGNEFKLQPATIFENFLFDSKDLE